MTEIDVNPDFLEILENIYTIPNEQNIGSEEPGDVGASLKLKSSDVASSLVLPPMYSTVRVNTITDGDVAATREALTEQLTQEYTRREWDVPDVYSLPDLPDTLVITHRPHIPREAPPVAEVIVDERCGMAVLRGADVFALGVLSLPQGVKVGDAVSVYVDMDSKCLRGVTKYEGRKRFVGSGILKLHRCLIFARGKFRGVAIEMIDPLYEAPPLSGILPGRVFPQNLPSIVCGHVLAPQPGERILDMCAAPGGKTTHIAALVQNQAKVIALDKSVTKVRQLEDKLAEFGATCVRCYVHDSTKLASNDCSVKDWPPYPDETFDRVLLDAPCSALGQRPRWRWDVTPKILRCYPSYQRKLLAQAVSVLKCGGTLVYSTCTLPVGENEAQVAWLLSKFPQMELVPQEPHFGGRGLPCEGLTRDLRVLLQRFHPGAVDGSANVYTDAIGFFIAKFRKKYRP